MADLDDFFAKKDRKKNKAKKFATADEIAKKLEETGKKDRSKKEKLTSQSQPSGQDVDDQGGQIQEDDEWKEFEEEKKDYSGLRIGKLQINDIEADGGGGEEDEQVMEENEAGEMVLRKKVQSGPWKIVNAQQEQPSHEVQEPTYVEKRPEREIHTSSTYVPPAKRNQPKELSHASPRGGGKSKAAPDINNEEFFPTLSASKGLDPNSGAWGRRRRDEGTFEEVRNSKSHSSRYADSAKVGGGGPKLSLGNKYGALSQDQS
ncbi:protein CDV3 homolog [Anabrus simplex]|uniref:protein CDV3 homolog n=1 Tax=Anabrus simplex TaxID=316456 RepID=UPI0034DD59AC